MTNHDPFGAFIETLEFDGVSYDDLFDTIPLAPFAVMPIVIAYPGCTRSFWLMSDGSLKPIDGHDSGDNVV